MKNKNLKIGISGGTFDPIHYGHLILAEYLRQEFLLDKVLFIPTGNPPHKIKNTVTDAHHRYNMVYNAVKDNEDFEACNIEINREGFTYTVDTIRELKKIYPHNTEFYFFIGADVVFDLLNWKYYEEIFLDCYMIAVLRPGFDKERFLERVEILNNNYNAKILTMKFPQVDISATIIRERVKATKSIRYLMPDSVIEYILDNNLYV